MRAGRLNRKISIRLPAVSTARSTDGGILYTESTVLSNVWANRQAISGRELFRQDQRWSQVTTRFYIRYSTAVTPACKVIDLGDSSAEYGIHAVINVGDEDRELEILTSRIT